MTEEVVATTPTPTPGMFDILPMPANVDTLPPPAPFYYLAGPDGYWVHKQTKFGRVLHKLQGALGHLPKADPVLWAQIPRIPAGLLGQVWSFFKQVYEELGTEAMVYLTYKDGQYRVYVPRQQNTGGHVNAKLDVEHIADGWSVIGDIHSHCNFGAFHSGTDTGDAAKSDGLHITIGKVLQPGAEWDTMISLGGINWKFNLSDVTVNGEQPNLVAHPQWWHRYVEKETFQNKWSGGQQSMWDGHGSTGYGYSAGYRPTGTTTPNSYTASYNPASGKTQLKRVYDQNTKLFGGIPYETLEGYYEDLEDQLNGTLIELEALGFDIDVRYYLKASNIDLVTLEHAGILEEGPIGESTWRGDDDDADGMPPHIATLHQKNVHDLTDEDWTELQEYYDKQPVPADRQIPASTTGAH